MSAKVDQTPVVESHDINKMSATNASSGAATTTATGGPKVSSMFAAKSGFVIPKNKLSGSLVPIFRGSKKPGTNDVANEESTNSVQRKTKWGPDLTQDAAVRKGRALAYQTRVDQIMQQLNSRSLEPEGNQDSQIVDKPADPKSSSPQIDTENSELLELEKREAIGEILKLNPTYKAPPDYKPLLKEASVPIPVKEYPGYNFIGLIFGPGSETQKRLEKETGAKIQVYGTKVNTEEKVEISPSDGSETQVAYAELSVHVSADTFEKVDATVSLIELLLTSVSGNLVAGDNANVPSQSQEASTPFVAPTVVNQGVVQPVVGPAQAPQQGQFQFQNPWFPAVTPQVPVHPPTGLIPQNSSAQIFNNHVNVHSLPFNPSTMPSLFGPPPVPSPGFNSILQNPSLVPARPQQPLQVLSNPYPPRNFPMPAPQPSSVQANILASLPSTGSQPLPVGPSPAVRPSLPQLVSTVSPGPQSDRPLTPVISSSGWSGASASVPASLGPGDMGQTVPPMLPVSGPWSVVAQSAFPPSASPPNVSTTNIVSPVSFASGSSTRQLSSVPMNHSGGPTFSSVPPPRLGPSPAPTPIQSSPLVASLPNSSLNSVLGSMPISSPMTPTSQPTLQSGIMGPLSGATANFTSMRSPTVTAPKLQHSGSGDFTFQPHHVQNTFQTVPRLSSQPAAQGAPPPRHVMQPLTPQASSFRLAVPNSTPSPGMQMFSRSQLGSQMVQSQAHMSDVPFAGNPTGPSPSPRLPAFPNASPVGPPVLQMGSRNFSPTPQLSNLAGPLPPRPGNSVQLQQNYPPLMAPRGQFMGPNQPFNKHLSFASGRPSSSLGGQQIYDPFSPTSASIASQQQGGNLGRGRKQESDPEYEDLMASVGVQ